jgi:translation elongation factor EF-Ts
MTEDKIKLIKDMRNRTGLGLLTCRKHLIKAAWDLEQAVKESGEHSFCV